MANLVVHSTVTKKNALIIGTIVAIFGFVFIIDMYAWLVKGRFNALELATISILLIAVLERMSARYTYELGRKSIIITKKGLFGRSTTHEVYYKDIFGIYQYKAKLIGYIKFRKTFRLNSALDGRDVWVLGYEVKDNDGKKLNYQVYFKPTPEMLAELEKKLPGKVHGTEEKTVTEMLKEEIKAEETTASKPADS